MKRLLTAALATLLVQSVLADGYDIVIYGGTASGVIAAVQAKKSGKTVIVVGPDKHLGGLSTGGLGFTDTGNKATIGGLSRDLPPGWVEQCRKFLGEVVVNFDESEKLLTRNRIFVDRTRDVGVISKADAIDYGLSGPNLRGSGVFLRTRKEDRSQP
jgi:NADPH-dependent 2,4-dienoyl-CoA reductase/sulfur reductase-like enzyme